jgi:hypothetical protein
VPPVGTVVSGASKSAGAKHDVYIKVCGCPTYRSNKQRNAKQERTGKKVRKSCEEKRVILQLLQYFACYRKKQRFIKTTHASITAFTCLFPVLPCLVLQCGCFAQNSLIFKNKE